MVVAGLGVAGDCRRRACYVGKGAASIEETSCGAGRRLLDRSWPLRSGHGCLVTRTDRTAGNSMENGQLRATVAVDSWAMVQGRMGRLLMGSAGARCWPLDRDDGGDERMVQKGWCARDGSGLLLALEELLAQGRWMEEELAGWIRLLVVGRRRRWAIILPFLGSRPCCRHSGRLRSADRSLAD
ncbi:hypothetical protein ACLOJK_022121, partial [Asimina triloba]